MTDTFVLYDLPDNKWAVLWPSLGDKFTEDMKFNLLDCIFKEVKCREVGLGVAMRAEEETTLMWISDDVFYRDITEEYSHHLYHYYIVRGAVFHHQNEAENFKTILEKRYMWQLLKN